MSLVAPRVRAVFAANALFLLLTVPAQALTIQLTREFDGVEPDANYATVVVTQNANGADLDFSVTLNGLLGSGEDAHEFYFNLSGVFTGLALTADNAPNNDYTFQTSPSVAGGAGSSFEYGVNFGNGAGPAGNGALSNATFTLSANEALTESDLLEVSSTNGGIEAIFALHVQGTCTDAGSETIGGNYSKPDVPEPSSLALLALAGVALARVRSRAR